MSTYLLVDCANTFFRARHVARYGDVEERVGMAIHVTINAIRKAHKMFGIDKTIYCLEGRSWRKDHYKQYKLNRVENRAKQSASEQEEDRMFWGAFDDFTTFIKEKSNATVVRHEHAEADDLIARWIQNHGSDKHVILSSDSDFKQLLKENVTIYNGVANEIWNLDGVFDDKMKPVIDKKTKEPKKIEDPEWILFEKCIRGDPTDNVFSAYPGVRKTKLEEAFNDRNDRGFNWNNLMLQKWVDHDGQERRVKEEYERNRMLIDLTQQPQEIKTAIDEMFAVSKAKPKVAQSGLHFMKFCGRHGLDKIAENAEQYISIFEK